ncbi:MAG TPA: AmmeMemoRadiSam system protein B, partial [Elusimicrobiales bacterium]|nr:AmmeMemoRadiSam system protein B [Elusimicrobiales bacterium]
MGIREPAVAGRFYDSSAMGLAETVDSFLKAKAVAPPAGEIKGLLVPHAGYAYSGPAAASAYALLGAA